MIPHESLGKEVYTVTVFGIEDALRLLINYPCVYYTCSRYERASDQAQHLHNMCVEYGITNTMDIRRVGRRVVAERGPDFNQATVELGLDAVMDRSVFD